MCCINQQQHAQTQSQDKDFTARPAHLINRSHRFEIRIPENQWLKGDRQNGREIGNKGDEVSKNNNIFCYLKYPAELIMKSTCSTTMP
jgi:hypothetical protein